MLLSTLLIVGLTIGCRENGQDATEFNLAPVQHRLSFAHLLPENEEAKHEAYLKEGVTETIRLVELPFFGMKEAEAIVDIRIRNNGESVSEIIGYSTGCGCSKVELECNTIAPGQQVSLRMLVRVNPALSVSKRVIVVGLVFNSNCRADIHLPVIAVPAVRVAAHTDNGGMALNAGTLFLPSNVNQDTLVSTELDVYGGLPNVGNARSSPVELMIRSIGPNSFQCELSSTGHSYSQQIGDIETLWIRYRVDICVPINSVLPQHVILELADQDGMNAAIELTVDRKAAIEIVPTSVVLKPGQSNADVTIRRTDGADIGRISAEYNERLLSATINPLDAKSVTVQLTVKEWTANRLDLQSLTLTTEDGLTSVVRIILISPE